MYIQFNIIKEEELILFTVKLLKVITDIILINKAFHTANGIESFISFTC